MKRLRTAPSEWVVAAVACNVALSSCAPAAHDVVPPSQDVVVQGSEPGRSARGYEHVARRPLGAVALAEARGVDLAAAVAATDRLADVLDACVTERGRRGAVVPGAARLIVRVGADGQVASAQLKLDPGLAPGAAEEAVLCLVAPAKSLAFAPAPSSTRALAIEALWGQLVPAGP